MLSATQPTNTLAHQANYYERNLRVMRFAGNPSTTSLAAAQALQPVAAPLTSASSSAFRKLDLQA
jgi:hypothetical protein